MIFTTAALLLLAGGTAASLMYYGSDADEEHDAAVQDKLNNQENNNPAADNASASERINPQDNPDLFELDFDDPNRYLPPGSDGNPGIRAVDITADGIEEKAFDDTDEGWAGANDWFDSRNPSSSTTNRRWINFSNVLRAQTNRQRQRENEFKAGGTLRYPYEALTDHMDYLQFDIQQYVPLGKTWRRRPGDGLRYVTGKTGDESVGDTKPEELSTSSRALINDGTILLPIPSNIGDTNSVKYGDSSLNGLQAAGAQAAYGIMKDADLTKLGTGPGRQELMNSLGSALQDFGSNTTRGVGGADVAKDVMLQYLTSQAVSVFGGNVTFDQIYARAQGEIINPNMELLFDAPTLRAFKFSFKMTPRNPMEAHQCKLIIRAFKRNMAAKAYGSSGSGDWFLKTPNVFGIRYRSGRKNHPFLNKFKQCFLTDCSVNYSGENVYSTYEDATPTSMILDLSFKETQPIYDVDYNQGPGEEGVGY